MSLTRIRPVFGQPIHRDPTGRELVTDQKLMVRVVALSASRNVRARSATTVGGLAFFVMDIVRREHRQAFITADGSTIRELAGVPSGNASNQSLAEAVVPPGSATIAHRHHLSEEIYLFTHGSGRMRLGDEERPVAAGDCVVIPPGVAHKLWADESQGLTLLCCCAPGYSDSDTELLED